jgi:hypothetical protein
VTVNTQEPTRPREKAAVTVAFHSDRGHTAKLAQHVAHGASVIDGVSVTCWPVDHPSDDLW